MARSSRTRRGRRGADYQAPAVQSRTREDRRREREAQLDDGDAAPAGSSREPALEPGREVHVPGRGALGFVGESWGELKKVEWPGQRQLVSATVAVIVAIAVVGAYLWVADAALSRLVRDVILNV